VGGPAKVAAAEVEEVWASRSQLSSGTSGSSRSSPADRREPHSHRSAPTPSRRRKSVPREDGLQQSAENEWGPRHEAVPELDRLREGPRRPPSSPAAALCPAGAPSAVLRGPLDGPRSRAIGAHARVRQPARRPAADEKVRGLPSGVWRHPLSALFACACAPRACQECAGRRALHAAHIPHHDRLDSSLELVAFRRRSLTPPQRLADTRSGRR
jgi:hypothetical protein